MLSFCVLCAPPCLFLQVGLDCDLGCPAMSPPTADLYIPEAIDPATAYYAGLKAVLVLHMAEVI